MSHKKKRKSNNRRSSTNIDEKCESHFSPVKVEDGSPSNYTTSGTLTGNERKVKDTVADVHNAISRWDELSVSGLAIMQKIGNLKVEALHAQGEDSDVKRSTLLSDMEVLFTDIVSILAKMRKQVEKLTKCVEVFEGIAKLVKFQLACNEPEVPLFVSWTTQQFVTTAKRLQEMYQKEFDAREVAMQNIAHSKDRQMVLVYTAIWLHSPYIDTDKDHLLHGMLLETGHISL